MSAFTFVDLFSGCGGMSCGFQRHKAFRALAAADAELAKPSTPAGSLNCNATYELNIGIRPKRINLGEVNSLELRQKLGLSDSQKVDVLLVCPPCTGFSRANPGNHLANDFRNSLVAKSAEFVAALDPDLVFMENAREVLTGNFPEHFLAFRHRVEQLGYQLTAGVHRLENFGLPQIRERSLVIASRRSIPLKTLCDLWGDFTPARESVSVRHALDFPRSPGDPANRAPKFSRPEVADRMANIPTDGGSWIDLNATRESRRFLTPAMNRILAAGKIGSHPDVYGRMSWNKPAPTIKRECAHVGNGRYAHPVKNRLLTVREMAVLQGFPRDFQFAGPSLSNLYRQIGDAVPPLISHQLAHLAHWMLTGEKPVLEDAFLPGTHLRKEDLSAVLA